MKKSELDKLIREEVEAFINEAKMKPGNYKPFDNLVKKLGGSQNDKEYLRSLVDGIYEAGWRKGALEGFSR